jgi:8-oxo-dGTP diphosphatase
MVELWGVKTLVAGKFFATAFNCCIFYNIFANSGSLSGKRMDKHFESYFKAAVSVDNVVFGFDLTGLKVLLIYRGADPYRNCWALPGDLISLDTNLIDSAEKVLQDLTGLEEIYMEQIHTFGKVDRHPYGRVFTVAYFALIKIDDYHLHPSSWAEEAAWFPISEIPELPFDHNEILSYAKDQLKSKIRRQPIGFELLPKHFTLTELQTLYESILETEFDVRNFRKKILSMDFISDTGLKQTSVTHRPAKLYKYNAKRYSNLINTGFAFDL